MAGRPIAPKVIALDEPLSEVELDALDGFLLSDETGNTALDLYAAHGLFTALHVGPELVPPSEWLPVVLGGKSPNRKMATIALSLLVRLYNEAGRAAATRDFEPLHYVHRSNEGLEIPILEEWCVGFLDGMALRRRAWKRAEADLARLLAPIRAFGVINMKTPGAPPFPQTLPEHLKLAQAIPDSVRRIRKYFREAERVELARLGRLELPRRGARARRQAKKR